MCDPPQLQNLDMDKPCEICGDVGVVDAIRVCYKCKLTREHAYCTREGYGNNVNNWVCDDCESANQRPLSKPVLSKQTSDIVVGFKIKKPPRNSKVQFLPPEEAMVLESGVMKKNSSPRKSSLPCRTTVSKAHLHKTDTARCTTVPPKFCVKPNPGPPGFRKLLNSRSFPISSEDRRLSASKDEGPGRQICGEPSTAEPLIFGEVPQPSADRDHMNSRQISSQLHSGISAVSSEINVRTDSLRKNSDSDDMEPLLMEVDRYLPNRLAMPSTWEGRFIITSDMLPQQSFDGIQAYPPCKVHRKVYDMLKQLPEALQFELLPRLNFWVDVFEDDVPGALDIGLYFLSCRRHEETYASLLDFLDEHDMLLRSCIDEVELLIFSSKHLHEDSQRIRQKNFLWGLFRSPEDNIAQDMEVDMAGGSDVGRVDVVVHRPSTVASVETSCLQNELEFERELQRSFDRFVKLMPSGEADCVKVRVKDEPGSP